jgi:hypothetical protein
MRFSAAKCLVLTLAAMPIAVASAQGSPEDGWSNRCYPRFSENVSALSGANARDCGFFDLQSSVADKERVRQCARRAARDDGPLKFGYLGYGIDSAFCIVAIRDNEGNYWELLFDFDVNGGAGDRPSPALWVSECKGLRFRRGRGDGFFELRSSEALDYASGVRLRSDSPDR